MEKLKQNNFVLPIEFLPYKQKIFKNLYTDLELIKTVTDEKSIYQTTFDPKTKVGKNFLPKWTEYYTTDTDFLKDSQIFYSNIVDISQNTGIVEDAFASWDSLQKETSFCEKYYYLEWDRLKWLNSSPTFLSFLSFYNVASPVLNLLAPLTLLFVPFIMLKLLKAPVTFSNYKEAMVAALKKHAIGKLFFTFNKVELSQKIYFSAMIGLYFYNIYQNAVVCHRFYKNLNYISKQFNTLKTYMQTTIDKITYIQSKCESCKTYEGFRNYLEENKQRLVGRLNKFSIIAKSGISLSNVSKLGKIMATYYDLYDGEETASIMNFSFEFNGYYDTLCGLNSNIKEKRLNKSKFSNSKKTIIKMKNVFYPILKENVVTNNINVKKNIILTGPNAAGKTTLLKSTIINLLFVQQLGFGYFKSSTITPFGYIHCYINIPDTSSRDSLFQAEARRCKDILTIIKKNPNAKHFCIFDELYSGTNPHEAISSAYSYLLYLSKKKNTKFILTTHFTSLCKLLDDTETISNKHMETSIVNNIPEYTYKITNGISEIKGGLCVLSQLEYPDEIISIAEEILKRM